MKIRSRPTWPRDDAGRKYGFRRKPFIHGQSISNFLELCDKIRLKFLLLGGRDARIAIIPDVSAEIEARKQIGVELELSAVAGFSDDLHDTSPERITLYTQ